MKYNPKGKVKIFHIKIKNLDVSYTPTKEL